MMPDDGPDMDAKDGALKITDINRYLQGSFVKIQIP